MGTELPSTTWKERVGDNEEQEFTLYGEQLAAIQKRHAGPKGSGTSGGTLSRALHAKAQLGVIADFEVLADIPPFAKVGLFKEPATYGAYVRFSNGSGTRQGDKKPDVRGVAIKLVGVSGKKVIPGMEDALTQDFLLVRTPSIPFRDAREFMTVVRAAESPALLLPRVLIALGLGRGFQLIKAILKGFKAPMASISQTRYFSAAPIRFGDYAVHFCLTPSVTGDTLEMGGDSYLGDELGARLKTGVVSFDYQVQFFVDEEKTPIEDPTVEWRESNAPFVTLARLKLRQADVTSASAQKVAQYIESLSFDPWHAQAELKPLGAIMRARNYAYRASTAARGVEPEPLELNTFE